MKKVICACIALLLMMGSALAVKGFRSIDPMVFAGMTRTAGEWIEDEESRGELTVLMACEIAIELSTDEGDFQFDAQRATYVGLSDGILSVILPGEANYVLGMYEPLTGEVSYGLYDVSLAERLIVSVQDVCGERFYANEEGLPEGAAERIAEALEDLG